MISGIISGRGMGQTYIVERPMTCWRPSPGKDSAIRLRGGCQGTMAAWLLLRGDSRTGLVLFFRRRKTWVIRRGCVAAGWWQCSVYNGSKIGREGKGMTKHDSRRAGDCLVSRARCLYRAAIPSPWVHTPYIVPLFLTHG